MTKSKPQPAKQNKSELWYRLGRFVTGITIACFFLPFFGVSCDGVDIVTMSGVDMAGGCKPGGLMAQIEQQQGPRSDPGAMKLDGVPQEPLAVAALALAVIVFGLSWVRSKRATTAAFVLSLACIGALIALYLEVSNDIDKHISRELGSQKPGARTEMMRDVKVDAGARLGLWAAVVTLLGVATLTGLALRERDTPR